ncbi:MAG: transcription termination factor Rho [Clostridium sp.]|nr:MAG: transcription termination factor Rho [Clostridium sp.]
MDFSREQLQDKNLFELREIARENRVQSPTKLNKEELISQIVEASSQRVKGLKNPPGFTPVETCRRPEKERAERRPRKKAAESINEIMAVDDTCEEREGILEIHPDGYGFIRVRNCEHSEKDVYVSAIKIRKAGLRQGDMIKGIVKVAYDNKPAALLIINTVNGVPAEELRKRPRFDDLVPIYPDERLKLENARSKNDFAIREIDLIAPIGKGQRGMIVSPPKAGKTTLLKKIANSISENYPDVTLIVLLIDERPEEVTDMQRSIKGEVVYSTFDEMPEHHTKAAELLLSRAKRLVENGKDVVILMDSLTRLARAYNLTIPATGKTLSGGIDPGALHSPKSFFGSARNIENGGSLTIIATALVDTGSRMDDVIYEEFKGTGNMEIHLDRKLSEKRIFPAIDLNRSGTRREDLLLSQDELEGVWTMRKILSSGDTESAAENLLQMLVKTSSNAEFIEQLKLQMRLIDKEGYTFRGTGLK